MLANDVFLLQGIGSQIVQFAVLEEAPAFPKHRCLIGPHLGLGVRRWIIREPGHPAVINDEDAVVRYLPLAPENGGQTHAVELGPFPGLDLAKIQQGGQDVLNLGQATYVARLPKPAFGPTDKAGHAVSALPDLGFLSSHPGIEILRAKQAAVVRFENQNGVFGQALVIEELHQLAHIPVDVSDHPQVKAEPILQATVQMIELGLGQCLSDYLAVFFLWPEGPVWSVGRNIAKKGFFLLDRFRNETLGLVEEDVGAIALELFFLSVVDVHVVEIVVAPIGGNRRDGGGGIPDAFLKTPVLWPKGIVCP